MCDLSGSHYILTMIDAVFMFLEVRAWMYLEIDERSSSSVLYTLNSGTPIILHNVHNILIIISNNNYNNNNNGMA